MIDSVMSNAGIELYRASGILAEGTINDASYSTKAARSNEL
jgi:hypothetical protein